MELLSACSGPCLSFLTCYERIAVTSSNYCFRSSFPPEDYKGSYILNAGLPRGIYGSLKYDLVFDLNSLRVERETESPSREGSYALRSPEMFIG